MCCTREGGGGRARREEDATDPQSRHKGKLNSEQLLRDSGANFTSVRPVYIYGPLNYNPVEEFFFHRLAADRPICVPNSGMQVTQLGHVKDLATAFVKCLGNGKASRQIYNVAGALPLFCAALDRSLDTLRIERIASESQSRLWRQGPTARRIAVKWPERPHCRRALRDVRRHREGVRRGHGQARARARALQPQGL